MVFRKRCSMVNCSVLGGKQFHFPRNPLRAEIWRRLCANPKLDDIPVESLFYKRHVCKKHFARSQYANDLMEKLLRDSIPCLSLPTSNSNDIIPCTSSDLSESVKAPCDNVVEVNLILPFKNYVATKGISTSSTCMHSLGNVTPPSISMDTMSSNLAAESENLKDRTSPIVNARENEDLAVEIDSENHGDWTSPIVNSGNIKDFAADIDLEKSSCQMTPLSVSEDGNDDPNEVNDFSENAPLSPDTCSTAQFLHGDQSGELPLSESASTENFFPINNDYRYTSCRLCFCFGNSLTGIFEDNQGNEFLISDAIEDLLCFKVSKADDFPQFICHECLDKLVEFKKFKDNLCKLRERFEESLYKLRKSSGEGRDDPDVAGSQSEGPTVEELEDSKDVDVMKHVNELEEMTNDFLPEYSEGFSQSGDASTDLEDTGMDELDVSEVESKEEEVTEKVLEEENKCYECGKIFEFKNLLSMHLQEHRKEWTLVCEYCEMRFKTLVNLNGHIIRHSNYKPYECEHCGLRCRLKTTLVKHKMVHSGDKPFLCSVCGTRFREKNQLVCHMRIHSGTKNFKCMECCMEFFSNVTLHRHLARHKRERSHVCGDCGKAFRCLDRLKNHVTCVHQKEKRFKCGICSKLFSLRLYLRNHMQIHYRNMM